MFNIANCGTITALQETERSDQTMNFEHDRGIVRPLGFQFPSCNPILALAVLVKRSHRLLPDPKLLLLFIFVYFFTATPGFGLRWTKQLPLRK